MAYGSYFPTGYQPYQMPQIQQQPQQIQNGGYMTVRSEDEARNYPIALGNSMTFFNEREPYCYKKTMGFSPLDRPTFERYRIIKEESPDIQENADSQTNTQENNKNAEMTKIKNDMSILSERIDRLEKRYESDKHFADVSADGLCGPGTIKAIQRKLSVKADGYMGPNTVKAFQTYLNKYL